MISESKDENKQSDKVHFQKIIIFGEKGVGKADFISYMENFDKDESKENKRKDSSNLDESSDNNNNSLVEQIKKISCNINEDRKVYYYVYEVNIDAFDYIKINLDTLLVQTECIIMMYNNKDSFENLPNLIETIESLISQNKLKNVPIFVVQNKIQIDSNNNNLSEKEEENEEKEIDNIIEDIKKENLNIIHKKVYVLEKDDYPTLFLEIDRKLFNPDYKNNNDFVNLVKFRYPFNKHKNEIINSYYNVTKLKIILLGEFKSGKTSFLHYLDDKIEDVKSIDISKSNRNYNEYNIYGKICNEEVYINLIDIEGEKPLDNIKDNLLQDVDGFLLFFDLSNEDSFKAIDNYLKKIESVNGTNQIILLGNKVDDNESRKIKKADVKEYIQDKNIKYYECSCKYGINIYEILNEISFMSFNRYQNNNEINVKFKGFTDKYKNKCNCFCCII